MLSSGENPNWVAQMMGHTSTEILSKRYTKFISNVIEKRWFGVSFCLEWILIGHQGKRKGITEFVTPRINLVEGARFELSTFGL